MARSDGSIIIDTRVDADGFGKGVKSMKSQIGGLTSAVGKLGAAIGLAFGVKALVDFGKSAIDLGSDLQEVQNVVDVTFSTMNEAVNEFAKNAAETAGLSETMAKRYTGTFGAMAKAFGFAEGQAFDMATSLTQLSGDVASFYNLTQDEAYTKLKSVFTGETESLKDLGVVMTQTALDSFAMAEGYGKTTKQMSEQEKVALRYAFVLDQLSSAQGDFVRTSDSWANQTRILSLNFDSFKANIGQALINIFTPFLKVLNQIVDKMAQLSQRFVEFSEMLVGKSTSGGGGSPGIAEEYEAIADNSNMAADGVGDFADSVKKANKETQKALSPLDNLNNLTSSMNEDLPTGGSYGIGDIANVDTKDINNLKKSSSIIDDILDHFISFFENKDWKGLGKFLSDGIVSGLDFLTEKLDDFDWNGLGEDIGEFLSGIDWVEIIKAGIRLKINIWKAIAEIWFGAFDAAPVETTIITALAILKFTGLGSALSSAMLGALTQSAFYSKFAPVGALVGKSIIGSLIAAVAGFALGQFLYEFITGEDITLSVREQFQKVKESFTDGSWKDALKLWGEDIKAGFQAMGKDIAEWWDELIYNMSKPIKELSDSIKGLFGEKGGAVVPVAPSLAIPKLATGAVLPPNAPFMAMLGDQRNGRNLEAPEGLIRQIMRDELAQLSLSRDNRPIVVEISGKEIFRVVQDEADEYFETTGREAFT